MNTTAFILEGFLPNYLHLLFYSTLSTSAFKLCLTFH